MTINRKPLILSSAIAVVLFLLYTNGFWLMYMKDRNRRCTLTPQQKSEIKAETRGLNGQELYEYSIKFTSKELSFSYKNDLKNRQANCIGYALLCAETFNYATRVNHIEGTAKPVVGYVYFLGVNLCKLFGFIMPDSHLKNFIKDHDFVEFTIDDNTFYADASAYDYIRNDCKTIKK